MKTKKMLIFLMSLFLTTPAVLVIAPAVLASEMPMDKVTAKGGASCDAGRRYKDEIAKREAQKRQQHDRATGQKIS